MVPSKSKFDLLGTILLQDPLLTLSPLLQRWRRIKSGKHVHASAQPFLIVHGTRDETVPFAQGQRLYAKLQAAGTDVTLIPVPDAYHNLRTDPHLRWEGEIWSQIAQWGLDFFEQHLKEVQ